MSGSLVWPGRFFGFCLSQILSIWIPVINNFSSRPWNLIALVLNFLALVCVHLQKLEVSIQIPLNGPQIALKYEQIYLQSRDQSFYYYWRRHNEKVNPPTILTLKFEIWIWFLSKLLENFPPFETSGGCRLVWGKTLTIIPTYYISLALEYIIFIWVSAPMYPICCYSFSLYNLR